MPESELVRGLRAARDHIENLDHWQREQPYPHPSDEESVGCIVTEMAGAFTSWNAVKRQAYKLLVEALPEKARPEVGGGDVPTLIVFNDKEAESREDVLALFDRAIEEALKREEVIVGV